MWNSGSSRRIHLINICRIIQVSQILFSSEIPLKIWSKFNYSIGQLCLDDTENIKALQIMGMKQRESAIVFNQTGSLQTSFSSKWLHSVRKSALLMMAQWKDIFPSLWIILVPEVAWGLDKYVQEILDFVSTVFWDQWQRNPCPIYTGFHEFW